MIRPIGKNISAVLDKATDRTAQGIYLAGQGAEALAPKIATVLAVGTEVTKVKVGERLIFKPYATYEVNLKPKHERKSDDDEQVMLEEDDILGVIEPDAPEKPAKGKSEKAPAN
jgi:co-chaperonin GroES (HSP10)